MRGFRHASFETSLRSPPHTPSIIESPTQAMRISPFAGSCPKPGDPRKVTTVPQENCKPRRRKPRRVEWIENIVKAPQRLLCRDLRMRFLCSRLFDGSLIVRILLGRVALLSVNPFSLRALGRRLVRLAALDGDARRFARPRPEHRIAAHIEMHAVPRAQLPVAE